MRFRCLIHSGVSSVRWIRSHMEDWPVLLITHFAWKWQRTFLWARSTSSEGCQRTQRSPHGGTTPFPLKAAHLTTTEVTLQGSLWVAQTVPEGGNCKPGPGAKMSGPPLERKCGPGVSNQRELSLAYSSNIQDAAHWGVSHPVLTVRTRDRLQSPFSPLPSSPKIHAM